LQHTDWTCSLNNILASLSSKHFFHSQNLLKLSYSLRDLNFKNLFRHSLAVNTARILSANILIQIISFFTLPFFARIYLPEDYGMWGIFIFLSGLITVISGLRYELAVMIPVSDNEASILVRVAKTNNLIINGTLLLLFFFTADFISAIMQLKTGTWLIMLIPLHSYFTGFNTLMAQWMSRKRKFRQLSAIRVFQSLLNIILSFVMGYLFNWHYKALILSTFISVLAGDILFLFYSGVSFYSGFIFRRSVMIRYIMKYKNFLYFSSPLALLNFFTTNILSYLLQLNFGSYILGLYTNATRLINTPLSLISASFSTVFYQQFSRTKSKVRLLTISFILLLIIFTSLLLPFILWGDELISWYLGEKWRPSSEFIRILSVVTIMSFTTGSISTIFSYLQKEDVVLLWQIIYLAAIIIVFSIYKNDFSPAMWLYSVTGGIAYLILFFIGLIKVKKTQTA
jgi:lipopolysaccharide exporter